MSGQEIKTQVLKDFIRDSKEECFFTDKYTILGEVFADITMSENENLKELVINISKLDDKHINDLNKIVKDLMTGEGEIYIYANK